MKYIRSFVFFLACVGSCVAHNMNAAEPFHVRVIWKEAPQTQATISWSSAGADDASFVRYATTKAAFDASATSSTDSSVASSTSVQHAVRHETLKNKDAPVVHLHHARLTDLQPWTRYYFTVQSNGETSRVFYFLTASDDAAQPFAILAGGDSRSDRRTRRRMNVLIAQQIAEDSTIIALCHAGDYVMNGKKDHQWLEWLSDYTYCVPADGHIVPLIPTRGNHERAGNEYAYVFDFPLESGNYFATRLSPSVLLTTLNTNISTSGIQRQFLEKTLQDNRSVRWQLANYHRPAYPAVKRAGSAKKDWVPLFERYNVDLVLESDGHAIKRTCAIRNDRPAADGVVYVGEGGLGVPQRMPDGQRWYLQSPGICGSGHHIQRLMFTPKRLHFTVIVADGSIFDRYDLYPRPR